MQRQARNFADILSGRVPLKSADGNGGATNTSADTKTKKTAANESDARSRDPPSKSIHVAAKVTAPSRVKVVSELMKLIRFQKKVFVMDFATGGNNSASHRLAGLSAEFSHVDFIEIEKSREIRANFNILSFPTIVVCKGDKELARSNSASIDEIRKLILTHAPIPKSNGADDNDDDDDGASKSSDVARKEGDANAVSESSDKSATSHWTEHLFGKDCDMLLREKEAVREGKSILTYFGYWGNSSSQSFLPLLTRFISKVESVGVVYVSQVAAKSEKDKARAQASFDAAIKSLPAKWPLKFERSEERLKLAKYFAVRRSHSRRVGRQVRRCLEF